jgi:DNA-binding transcriptional ArsR family regulator
MARPRAPLTDEQVLDHIRIHQPVSVSMLAAHFGYSKPFFRGRLEALNDAGVLARAPDRPPDEVEGGRPARLYAMPDWPGLPANQRRDMPKLTEAQVLAVLNEIRRCPFTLLHATLEAPLGELRTVLLGLIRSGRVVTGEDGGLTYYEPIA